MKDYKSKKENNLIQGVLSGNERGYAFLLNDGGDFFISPSDLFGALHGDTVEVIEVKSSGHSRQAKVVRIIERGYQKIVGTFSKCKGGGFVIADDRKFFADIFVESKNLSGAKDGDKVECKITDYPKRKNPQGIILSVIGQQFDRQTEVKCIEMTYGLEREFPKAVLKEVEKIPADLDMDDIFSRKDLRFKDIVTIDGETAKDFDDAISIEKQGKNYVLGVHIADVTHYVKPFSAIDKEAFKRATSVYFPERVIPMLPPKLCDDLCSLKEGVDRLTLSCIMTVDPNGTVIKSQIVKSVIRSLHRLTYNKVQAIFDGDKILRKEYADILPALGQMKDLAEILIKKRAVRGSIDLDIKESEIIIDSKGNIEIGERSRKFADKIIEEFMILANETVAKTFSEKVIPFVYRVHDRPSEEKTLSFMQFVKDLGLAGSIPTENPTPKDYSNLLDSVKGSPKYQIVNEILLRSLQKAVYHTENKGHFGLASENYCHFTSPIRRYPDLAIHRIIKSVLDGASDLEKRYRGFAEETARQSSLKERNAQDAERAMDDYYKAVYMQGKIGESFEGVISGVTSFGIFVRLENTVEGLVRIDTLTGGWYDFDETRLTLKNNKYSYTIGQTVNITVVGVDYASRKPDFIISDNYFKDRRKYKNVKL